IPPDASHQHFGSQIPSSVVKKKHRNEAMQDRPSMSSNSSKKSLHTSYKTRSLNQSLLVNDMEFQDSGPSHDVIVEKDKLKKKENDKLRENFADEVKMEILLEPTSNKLLVEFQVLNYARENAHLKATYKNLFDSISVSRAQTKTIIASLQNELQSNIYKNAKLRTRLFKKVSDQKDNTQDTSVNTKFAKQPIEKNLSKVGKTNTLSNPVTSNSVSTPQESKGVNNDKVIAPGMFRINLDKTSREAKKVPNTVRARNRTKPITVSQPHVITKKDVNSHLNGLSSTGVDNTKTKRPQPRSNIKNDRVLSASKSSQSQNKEAEVEEHHRNLLLSKNNKHISSTCNNIKIDSRDVISKVVCVMCKKCLISVNHDNCLSNFVNAKNSCGKNQKAKVSVKEIQMKYQPKVSKPKTHMTGNLKLLINFIWKFMGTIRFGNDHVAAILGFGDLQWGNILITRVFFIEGLGHNLFSVGQFCDSDLEVAFRRDACFVRNLEGVDLLKGDRSTNLYTINLHEMASASPIYIGKLGAKGDIGFFIGYSADSCAYRVYNRRTKKIIETMNVLFDELSAMAFEQRSSKPGLQSMTSGQISSGLDLTYAPSTITMQQPSEGELDLLFEDMYDDYIGGQPSATGRTVSPAQEPQDVDELNPDAMVDVSNMEPKNVKEAMTDLAWIDSMQDEHLQFKRLDVWVLVPAPDNISPLTLKWLFKNKHDEDQTGTIDPTLFIRRFQDDILVVQVYVDDIIFGSTHPRPDIVHATCLCARYQAKPTEKHLKEVKRIFRYLWGTINMGLWYTKDSGFELTGFSDVDYAGCKDTFKSTSGGAQFLGEKLVSWSSKKQDCTTLSTAEAEYVSLSTCYAQVLWMRT
nr:uncharacterized mitochondrial protein AtMg00810-like [Tanacetum cinerariifolium]